jgi:hypothetical protein
MNNKIDNKINTEEVNWKYLPNILQISQYLPQQDLIHLSLTCLQVRNKLYPAIFRKLELINGGKIIPYKPNIPSMRKQLEILTDILEDDYLDKYHFVKHCILWKPCNNPFVIRLFNIFIHITNLEINFAYNYMDRHGCFPVSGTYLTKALKPLKKLEVLTLDCRIIKFLEAGSESNFKFPTCLKELNIVGRLSGGLSFDSIENINPEYTELKKVIIINNNMLTNMSGPFKSLTEVTIPDISYFCPKLLNSFFLINSQLKKISISLEFLDNNVVNTILQLKNLYQLNITNTYDVEIDRMKILTTNTSIRYLYFYYNLSQNALLPILSSLKSIHTLEISNCVFKNFIDLDWSSYNGKIPLLHLNHVWNTDYKTNELLNLGIFDKIRFTDNFNLEWYLKYNCFGELQGWEIIQDYPLNVFEFNLVKKLEEELNN